MGCGAPRLRGARADRTVAYPGGCQRCLVCPCGARCCWPEDSFSRFPSPYPPSCFRELAVLKKLNEWNGPLKQQGRHDG
ncbi:hypothetical protein AV530_016663 [Patagioenas fasciata monilis]|uniref:Uncharacterized protein n=1 Tax=Patagioenas fasciata monilis TaxID=372326 RepID=A0A1V4J3L4_PATFA|nr:hypothetical protein AV530_016663 [Patagioenas fasciata monilis]